MEILLVSFCRLQHAWRAPAAATKSRREQQKGPCHSLPKTPSASSHAREPKIMRFSAHLVSYLTTVSIRTILCPPCPHYCDLCRTSCTPSMYCMCSAGAGVWWCNAWCSSTTLLVDESDQLKKKIAVTACAKVWSTTSVGTAASRQCNVST
ncbi:hypothetical protein B0T10DRAFT_471816 [Thelonectria olida]|uniref:Uncharacterized protein n=1 Tax=Thelonectria olida TaxID=1576542 RepID=A0A9P8WFX2_9HYPO|nr:hypothetical protein B0T10DRAFT_471816 [Thelonectria olida]